MSLDFPIVLVPITYSHKTAIAIITILLCLVTIIMYMIKIK